MTTFNHCQIRAVAEELTHFAATAPPVEAEVARRLLEMTELVYNKPDRYLVFVGD